MGAVKCVELKPFHCVYKELKWLTEATIYGVINILYLAQQKPMLHTHTYMYAIYAFCFRHCNRSIGIHHTNMLALVVCCSMLAYSILS